MKYLYLLIRHLFPRHRWTIISKTNLWDGQDKPYGTILTLRDQFGNIRTKKIQG